MRSHRAQVDTAPLTATDGISMGIDRPFVLTIGIAFQVCTILLGASILTQAILMINDFDGDDMDIVKQYFTCGYVMVYSIYLMAIAITPFFSLKNQKPRYYEFYKNPYIHIAMATYALMVTCPDTVFDDGIINETQSSFWIISLVFDGFLLIWAIFAIVNRKELRLWAGCPQG